MSASATSPVSPPDAPDRAFQALLERAAEDMARRWRAGERPVAEQYLEQYSELAAQPDLVLELIAEEMYLRQECGEEPAAAAFARRFPQWRRQVLALADCQRLLATEFRPPRFPVAGETLGAFRLLTELGRGAHGRVFLATQAAHADRPVVLKLTPGGSDEHLSLSRLQHTHIVPLYSFHDFPARGLRGLCQPHFGGATLADLLHALAAVPPARRTGRDLLQALEESRAAVPLAPPVQGPACTFLARASYVQAVCWLGACLADALQYAHERGLLHLDLKPSNVLLAADGQPMLLDFHLARARLAAGDAAPESLGGTSGYMAPEHQAALTAVAARRPLTAPLDGRADVYALGMLLSTLLGAERSGETPDPKRRREKLPVTVGLADLLARCVAPEPSDRYASAADLAADLRRYLADQPLRGVANRSLSERWQKWQRRRPYALPLVGLLLVAVLAGACWLGHGARRTAAAEAALHKGEEQLLHHRYAEALELFRSGSALAEDAPFRFPLRQALCDGAKRAERGRATAELHVLCERVRGAYETAHLTAEQARDMEAQCRNLWQERGRIAGQLRGQAAPELDEQLQSDLLDLAILLANLLVRQAPGAAAQQEALTVLDEAERLFGPRRVLAYERHLHALALGRMDEADAAARQAAQLTPNGSWEHYALGRAYLRAGDLTQAAAELDSALALEPQAFWPNFTRGVCSDRAGQFADALGAFSACVVLAPQSAPCYYNRGRVYAELGRFEAANRDLDHALKLDPNNEPARELRDRLLQTP